MRKKINWKASLRAALILVMLIGAAISAFHISRGTFWKLLPSLPYIDTYHMDTMTSRYNNFDGMDIDDVLRLTTKKENYIIFDQQTEHQGRAYEEWIEQYPELTLDRTSKAVLYCIPVVSSRDREEAYLYGYFVDDEGKVSAGPIDVWFLWE